MADEGVEHCGQGELERCEVTRTRTSSAVSLTAVISRPSGKGNKGDEGINFLEKRFLGWLEQIFEEIPQYITLASPKSWKSQLYIGVNKRGPPWSFSERKWPGRVLPLLSNTRGVCVLQPSPRAH